MKADCHVVITSQSIQEVSLADAQRVTAAVFHCSQWFKTFKYISTLITTSTSDGCDVIYQ